VHEVRADAVHLVDVTEARHVVLVREAPVGLGLRLDAGDAVEHDDRAVEHAEAAVHFDREVDVSGGVDQVDLIALPLGRHGSALNRDATLPLLLQVVGGGAGLAVLGVVHLDDLVLLAGVVEHPFGGRGLTGIDVRDDADIAVELERFLSSHVPVAKMNGSRPEIRPENRALYRFGANVEGQPRRPPASGDRQRAPRHGRPRPWPVGRCPGGDGRTASRHRHALGCAAVAGVGAALSATIV
jgi:hypothetical protein